MGRTPDPPRLLRWALSGALGEGPVGASMAADLREEFVARARRDGKTKARWWYRREATGLLARTVWRRLAGRDGWERSPEATRDGRGDPMAMRWWTEVRQAGRSLLRAPGFTTVASLTLALGIGANAAVFSVVDGVLLEPLPFRHADRLMVINSAAPGVNAPPEFGVSPEFYLQYRDAPAIEDLGLHSGFGGILQLDEGAERMRMAKVTPSVFTTLGVAPILGRLPRPDELAAGEQPFVLLSHALWSRSFGSDPGVLGRTVRILGSTFEVIGVMGPDAAFPEAETAAWIPREIDPETVQPGQFGSRLVARVAPGTTETSLQRQLAPLVARLPERFADSPNYVAFLTDGELRPVVRLLREEVVGDMELPLWILLGTVGFVLLIACANVANLMLVRAESRSRAVAVRAALGAGRGAIVRTHLSEALVLAGLGGSVGALIAWVGVPALVRAAPEGMPRLGEVALDGGVLLFTAGVTLAAALLFGLAPALRYSAPEVLAVLRSSGRGSVGRSRHTGRNALVAGQAALAFVLLVGSGLMIRSFWRLSQVDPGYDTEGILTFQIALTGDRYPDGYAVASFHQSFLDWIAGLPGVESVGAVNELPLDESSSGAGFEFDGQESGEGQGGRTLVYFTYAAPGYFETMGIELLAGRTFRRADHETDFGNAVVSRGLAEKHWPGEDPLGKRLRFSGDTTGWETVVGVVEDVRDQDLGQPPRELLYLPLAGRQPSWAVNSPAYTVRAANPGALVAPIREELHRREPTSPLYFVQTMEEVVAESVVQLSFTMLALGASALVALVLGLIGLYGVLSYVVTQRTREIGVRLAVGAQPREVRRMVVWQGARLVALGLVVGVAGAAGLVRLLTGMLFGTEPMDPATFAGTAGLMLVAGLVASYLPARRASSVDPVTAMRPE